MSERIQNEEIGMLLKEFVEQTVKFYDGLKTGEDEIPQDFKLPITDVFSVGLFQRDKLTDFLDEVRQRCRFQAWFFGHYHADMDIDEQFKMLYEKIVKLDI